jgi:cold shock CspA family protein/ribosome-associated translation inhibitor RaiA
MDKPLGITFHNLDRSESVIAVIREKYGKLERFHRHIVGMNVKVEMPKNHHRHGNHYRVTIEVTVPGQRLVASRSSDKRARHEAPLPTINDAFKAITRKLEDYARKQRGDIKHHDTPPMGRVVRMFPEYGFVRLTDGREVYFHKNSVLHPGFKQLNEGAPVRIVMAEGESAEGPQATTVEVVHDMNLVDERNSPFKTVA